MGSEAAAAPVENNLPALRFEVVSSDILLDGTGGYLELLYEPIRRRLIASNGITICSIDPQTGATKVLHETPFRHDISCLCPRTGNVVFYTANGWQFFELSMESFSVSEVVLPVIDEPYRVIFTDQGEKIALGIDPVDWDELIYKTDVAGQWHQVYVRGGENIFWNDTANGKALVSRVGNAIFAWFFDDCELTQVAGRADQPGDKDGIGIHARFGQLRKPVLSNRHIYVRTQSEPGDYRFAQIDMETQAVQSMRFVGLEHEDVIKYAAADHELFVLRKHPNDRKRVQLLRAALAQEERDTSAQLLGQAARELELSEPVRPIVFRLRGGVSLQMDRRLLIARSAYFRSMLTSGLREDECGEVDLTTDADADEESLGVLLRFVLSNTWEGADSDPELIFRVRALADRYRLAGLVDLAEARLCRLLRPGNVLSFLGRALGSSGALEESCWALLASDRASVVSENEAQLDTLIVENPRLAKELLLRFFNGDTSCRAASMTPEPRKRRREG